MSLPCGACGKFTPDSLYTPDQCRVCWLNHHDASYRAHWSRSLQDAPPGKVHRCPHLWKRVRTAEGKVAARTCTTCPGAAALDLFECRCPGRRQLGGKHDEVTLLDCQTCDYRPRLPMADARKLILVNHLSPGDVLVMTMAVHGAVRRHPGKFRFAVDVTAPELWQFNPDVEPLEAAQKEGWDRVVMHYPLIDECNQRLYHMAHGYAEFLAHVLQAEVPLLTNRPLVYLSPEERGWINQVHQDFGYAGKFWLVCAGRKQDYTAKFWGTRSYQRLVDILRGKVVFVQVGAAEHHHPPLDGVLNLVGKTDLRQLVRLCWHAQGGVGGTTLLMHLAASLRKPYLCLMGGREPVPWNSYPFQQLFHTVGQLSCCREGGCWKSRVVKLNDGSAQDGSLCEFPVPGTEPVPRCLSLISPEEVASRLLLYPT